MINRRIGKFFSELPALGMGTEGFSSIVDEKNSINVIRAAIDYGIKLFDTAETYGNGLCESVLGKAVHGNRDNVLIATKFFPSNGTEKKMIIAAEKSLNRLNTDYIDIYQTHWPNNSIPVESTVQGFIKLVEQGKVRSIGLSNVTPKTIKNYLSILPKDFPLFTIQQEYNLTERFVEKEILPLCRRNHWGMIAYSPLAHGKLANKMPRLLKFDKLALEYGLSTAQLALRWVLEQNPVFAIPMTSNIVHLKANVDAASKVVPAECLDLISTMVNTEIKDVPIECIIVPPQDGVPSYNSLEEAKANNFKLSPSPSDIAEEIRENGLLKPVSISQCSHDKFILLEGQLRYWGWCIAFDCLKPIPANIAIT